MGSESALWTCLRGKLPSQAHAVRVENTVQVGTPDVNFCLGGLDVWLELKQLDDWPKREKTRVVLGMREGQAPWIIKRTIAGGLAFVFAQIGREYFLYEAFAVNRLDTLNQQEMRDQAVWTGRQPLDVNRLLDVVKNV